MNNFKVLGVKIFSSVILVFVSYFFVSNWLNYLSIRNNSIIVDAEVVSENHISSYYYDISVKILMNRKVYISTLSARKKYKSGEKLHVYFNPERPKQVFLINKNLLLIPILVSLSLIICIILNIITYTKPWLVINNMRGSDSAV